MPRDDADDAHDRGSGAPLLPPDGVAWPPEPAAPAPAPQVPELPPAVARRPAGAEIADMEFMQFHPTALDSDATVKFLITEALRGEGAYLLDCGLERFMPALHPLAELAPRDVVSREIEGFHDLGLIAAGRGKITILDRAGLQSLTCP